MCRTRFAAAALATTLVFASQGTLTARGLEGSPPIVEAILSDQVGVPEAVLAEARAHARQVFASAGIKLTWTTQPGATGARWVVVFLVNHPGASGRPSGAGPDEALGRATPSVSRALAYVDRVAAAIAGRPVSAGVALGQVLAHEIGHLLLPSRRHSLGGIMRPRLDFDRPLFVNFTRGEAEAMRAGLSNVGTRSAAVAP